MTNLDKAREAARAHLNHPAGTFTGATALDDRFGVNPWSVVYILADDTDQDADWCLRCSGGLRLTCEGKPTVLISAAGEVTEEP